MEGQDLSDPSVITGAFAGKELKLQAEISGDILVFRSPGSSQKRVYHLLPLGISFTIENSVPGQSEILRIPIIFDPWDRFHPGWVEPFSEIIDSEG
jgi:hypothetical protein